MQAANIYQLATSAKAETFNGVIRTIISPGVEFLLPYASAWSSPMYRPPMRVAQ
jgi:hypothetical protein